MKKILMRHQQAGLSFLNDRGGGPLYMEMRLGKTLTAIRFIKYRLRFPCLVIAPYNVMDEWAKQLGEDEEKHTVVLTGNRRQRLSALDDTKRWYISNYESARSLELYKAKNWKSVILDESIRIANPKARITLHALNKFKNVSTKLILCGNPAPENEMQLVCQFIFVYGQFMGCHNYWSFRSRFYTNVGHDWIPKNNSKQVIRDYVKQNAFVLSRHDAGMGEKKIYETRIVKMNDLQHKQIESIKYDFEYGDKEVKNSLGQLISWAYVAGGLTCEDTHEVICDEKLKELCYLLSNELKGQKVLVWCKFRAEQDAICKHLKSKGVMYVEINGDVPLPEREIRKSIWETSATTNTAVLTISSSAKGKDWSAADTSIYYSNEHSNDLRSQSEDRIVDIRKKVPLLYIDLQSEESVDVEILQALKDKSFDSQLIMNDYKKRLGIV
jgi:SNF2 family DNA or RNA helicase